MKEKLAHIELSCIDKKLRLDKFLSLMTPYSRENIIQSIRSGTVQINEKTIKKPSHLLQPQDLVTAEIYGPTPLKAEPEQGPLLEILFEDEDLIVINKPVGLVVHPSAGHRSKTLVNFLLHQLQSSPTFEKLDPIRPGIVHRLDMGTSGAIIITKNAQAQSLISEAFKERKIKKTYHAICWGAPPPQGVNNLSIGRDPIQRTKMKCEGEHAKEALTEWQVLKSWPDMSLLKINLHTGRTHQIRVHMQNKGFPLLNDSLYTLRQWGGKWNSLSSSLQDHFRDQPSPLLHAKEISFDHPSTNKTLTLKADYSDYFQKTIELLNEHYQ